MNNRIEVVTIGETMLMLFPPRFQLIECSDVLKVIIGGAESNVAIALQKLGINSGWISKQVDNPLGRRIVNSIRSFGVDVSRVVWTKTGRVGIMFVEFGVTPRPIKTIYDRANSAITALKFEEIDWEYVKQAKLLHLTGITPALSQECRRSVIKAVKKAKNLGLKISFDVNYRSLLWIPEKARETLDNILPYVDVLLSTLKDAHILLETSLPPEQTAIKLKKTYGNEVIVITLGDKGSLARSTRTYYGQAYSLREVNRLGAGDAFAAGFIYGYLKQKGANGIKLGLKYGSAMAALKHTIPENIFILNRKDVEDFIKGSKNDVCR